MCKRNYAPTLKAGWGHWPSHDSKGCPTLHMTESGGEFRQKLEALDGCRNPHWAAICRIFNSRHGGLAAGPSLLSVRKFGRKHQDDFQLATGCDLRVRVKKDPV